VGEGKLNKLVQKGSDDSYLIMRDVVHRRCFWMEAKSEDLLNEIHFEREEA